MKNSNLVQETNFPPFFFKVPFTDEFRECHFHFNPYLELELNCLFHDFSVSDLKTSDIICYPSISEYFTDVTLAARV